MGRKANRKVCSYILQDDNLFPWFTVLESMTLAARLKIGNKSHTYRQFMVSGVGELSLAREQVVNEFINYRLTPFWRT